MLLERFIVYGKEHPAHDPRPLGSYRSKWRAVLRAVWFVLIESKETMSADAWVKDKFDDKVVN